MKRLIDPIAKLSSLETRSAAPVTGTVTEIATCRRRHLDFMPAGITGLVGVVFLFLFSGPTTVFADTEVRLSIDSVFFNTFDRNYSSSPIAHWHFSDGGVDGYEFVSDLWPVGDNPVLARRPRTSVDTIYQLRRSACYWKPPYREVMVAWEAGLTGNILSPRDGLFDPDPGAPPHSYSLGLCTMTHPTLRMSLVDENGREREVRATEVRFAAKAHLTRCTGTNYPHLLDNPCRQEPKNSSCTEAILAPGFCVGSQLQQGIADDTTFYVSIEEGNTLWAEKTLATTLKTYDVDQQTQFPKRIIREMTFVEPEPVPNVNTFEWTTPEYADGTWQENYDPFFAVHSVRFFKGSSPNNLELISPSGIWMVSSTLDEHHAPSRFRFCTGTTVETCIAYSEVTPTYLHSDISSRLIWRVEFAKSQASSKETVWIDFRLGEQTVLELQHPDLAYFAPQNLRFPAFDVRRKSRWEPVSFFLQNVGSHYSGSELDIVSVGCDRDCEVILDPSGSRPSGVTNASLRDGFKMSTGQQLDLQTRLKASEPGDITTWLEVDYRLPGTPVACQSHAPCISMPMCDEHRCVCNRKLDQCVGRFSTGARGTATPGTYAHNDINITLSATPWPPRHSEPGNYRYLHVLNTSYNDIRMTNLQLPNSDKFRIGASYLNSEPSRTTCTGDRCLMERVSRGGWFSLLLRRLDPLCDREAGSGHIQLTFDECLDPSPCDDSSYWVSVPDPNNTLRQLLRSEVGAICVNFPQTNPRTGNGG